jgi:V8-like Glu-specific endopeptidase
MKEQTPLFLDKLADAADYAVIGPTDNRTQVLDARRFPYAAICHLERDFGNGRLTGCTGFLVAPRIVVTAGHCVHSVPRQLLGRPPSPTRIRVTPGRNGRNSAPFGSQWAAAWRPHPAFAQRRDAKRDIGVVVLPRPFVGIRRFLPLGTPGDAAMREIRRLRLLHVAGYPGDKPPGTAWEHSERLDRFTARSLFYSVDTCPGHSGSPVWVETGPQRAAEVIGVHVAGPRPHEGGAWGCRPGVPMAPAGAFNRGVRLSQARRRDLQRILAALPGVNARLTLD